MRKVLVVLFLGIAWSLSGATYYIANSGNDSNPGTITKPWATMSKVTNTPFAGGDIILFKRGDTFRGDIQINSSGSASLGYITIGAYGKETDPKPKLFSSVDASANSFWTIYSGNIWRTSSLVVTKLNDCANIIFNGDTSCGWLKQTIDGCTKQGDWYYDPRTKYVYLFSTSNPGSYYSNIEIGGIYLDEVILVEGESYIIIQDLDVRYSANNGILCKYGADNIIIQRNDISWIGGVYYRQEYPTRMGNGIGSWMNVSNITVRYNKIWQCYDAGYSPQGHGVYSSSNIDFHHNTISNCYYGIEFWTSPGQNLTNISFNNNVIANTGYQWSEAQRPRKGQEHALRFWGLDTPVANFNVKNNIIINSLRAGFQCDNGFECINLDYNLYYVTTVAKTSVPVNTLAQWQMSFGKDLHSISADPLFNSSTDFHLLPGSPAIDAGANLGYTLDFEGVVITGTPEIGAYQYVGTTANPAGKHNVTTNGSDSNPCTIRQP